MGTCLVTKLKESVKSDIPFYDGIRFYYTAEALTGANPAIICDEVVPAIVKTFNESYDSLNEIVCNAKGPTNLTNLFASGSFGVITPKGKIQTLAMNIAGGSVPNNFRIELEDIKGMDLEEVRLDRNYAQDGDIANFSDMENLSFVWLYQTSIKGRIDDLKNMKSLSTFGALELSPIEGDFGVFIQNMRDCGRITGTITTPSGFWLTKDYAKKNLTYLGLTINPSKAESGRIYWDADKSYVKKGIQVWCAGYSDSEISSNKVSGGIWDGCEVVSVA